jgi:hypothetical protein
MLLFKNILQTSKDTMRQVILVTKIKTDISILCQELMMSLILQDTDCQLDKWKNI